MSAEKELMVHPDAGSTNDLDRKMVSALVAIAEVYMTDECYAPEAEGECERCLIAALELDPSSVEALQALASFRLSQQRPAEALVVLKQAREALKAAAQVDVVPSYSLEVQAAKLFLELGRPRIASSILGRLVEEFDEDAEAWFLLGFALNHFDPTEAEACLRHCIELLDAQHVADEAIRGQVAAEITRSRQRQDHPDVLTAIAPDDVDEYFDEDEADEEEEAEKGDGREEKDDMDI